MLALIELRENSDPPASAGDAVLHERFSPLTERAVRRDGTIGLRLIGPGWGSSGYYGRDVLERDVPRIFPPGTKMYWNHDTPTEEAERPEGDLSRLAAVTISPPIWLDDGPKGPGMYADARPFTGYAETINEIADHIGVSIRALGRHRFGEAEGRQGAIIQELAIGKSIDFVTEPGAGGAIVSLFESAGNGRLPDPALLKALREAQNIGEWLESRLHLSLSQVGDEMYGEGRVNRDERKAMSGAIGQALDAYRQALMQNSPQLFQRSMWADAPESDDVAALGGVDESARPDAAQYKVEVHVMDLKEVQEALAAAQAQLQERDKALSDRDAALQTVQAQLLQREARDFVAGKLAEAALPDIVRTRLGRELATDPPLVDGRIDEAAYGKRVETAVAEAMAEIAAIAGSSGAVTGMGESAPAGTGKLPTLAESQERINAALANLTGV